ncbi:MAG: alpha/beta hydrolase [Bacteroidota bacterium]
MKAIMKTGNIVVILWLLSKVLFVLGCGTQKLSGQTPTNQPAMPFKSGYAPVNGLKMYYEMYGSGRPLVLLHGAFSGINSFAELIPEWSKNRQVIAAEMQGHVRTADIDRPFSIEAMGKDVIALLEYLKIDSADFFGYSMGGEIAFQVAIQRPEMVRKLIIASATSNSDGWLPEVHAVYPTITPELFEGSPPKMDYDRLAPDPKHWAAFVNKMKEMFVKPFDMLPALVRLPKKPPTFIIIGDSDGIRHEHAVEMFRLFGGGVVGDFAGLPQSQLAVLPATTHVGVMMQTEWLRTAVPAFLDSSSQNPSRH